MTGPEHYKAAEELLDIADERDVDGQLMTALAQVHATLALAAASATAGRMGYKAALAWEQVAGADS